MVTNSLYIKCKHHSLIHSSLHLKNDYSYINLKFDITIPLILHMCNKKRLKNILTTYNIVSYEVGLFSVKIKLAYLYRFLYKHINKYRRTMKGFFENLILRVETVLGSGAVVYIFSQISGQKNNLFCFII